MGSTSTSACSVSCSWNSAWVAANPSCKCSFSSNLSSASSSPSLWSAISVCCSSSATSDNSSSNDCPAAWTVSSNFIDSELSNMCSEIISCWFSFRSSSAETLLITDSSTSSELKFSSAKFSWETSQFWSVLSSSYAVVFSSKVSWLIEISSWSSFSSEFLSASSLKCA